MHLFQAAPPRVPRTALRAHPFAHLPKRRISLSGMLSRDTRPSVIDKLKHPIILAPLAGGPSTPLLAAAVSKAGGLGFIATGYLSPEITAGRIKETRELCGQLPFGVNLFVPSSTPPADPAVVKTYADTLKAEAGILQVPLESLDGRHDRDFFDEKIELLTKEPVPLVSFTFGCPSAEVVRALHASKSTQVWVTVTSPQEAKQAADVGADALVVQGVEAGGHQASFVDSNNLPLYSLLPLLQLTRRVTSLPLIAAGGIMTGEALSAVLCAGARAAQLGTAFLCAKEAGTNDLHKAAVLSSKDTTLTRVFSGRTARGIVNRWTVKYESAAPIAYPEVNNLTMPLRAAALKGGDSESINLWAGQAHALVEQLSAAEIVQKIAAQARASLAEATTKIGKE